MAKDLPSFIAQEGAKREGVSDIQGYFNPNNRDPIRFIDIHFR